MKRISIILVAVIASLAMVSCNNKDNAKVELKNFDDSLSYAIGMRLYDMYEGDNLNNETDSAIVLKAFTDKLNKQEVSKESQKEP